MNFKDILSEVSPDQWAVSQIIALGWYDGPTEGFCELSNPACCFYFKVIAERFNPDDLDDRLFRWNMMPSGSVERAMTMLRVLGEPTKPSWVPIWKFESEDLRQETERKLKELLSTREQKGGIIVRTSDMVQFLDFWLEYNYLDAAFAESQF